MITERLHAECDCVPVDLPGFGAAADVVGYSVSDMADYLVTAIRPPTVPPGTSRIRLAMTAAHDEAVVGRIIEALTGALAETAG